MQKLILPTALEAAEHVAELTFFNPGSEFAVYPLGHARYQVVEIKKLAGAGWFWEGRCWTRWTRKMTEEAVVKSVVPAVNDEVVSVPLAFKAETAAWIEVYQDNAVRYFKKSALVSWEIVESVIILTLPKKVAVKRGLVEA